MKATILPSGRVRHIPHFYLFTFVFCLVFCLSLFTAPSALGQIPQGFTYQAVAFNESGEPIRNTALPVRISIEA
ncbi:MAG: hypothetical protein RBS37_10825, partial [Bacteroidales bacterium]|nr:hypothetical protein [Bacteroidales bacterium]